MVLQIDPLKESFDTMTTAQKKQVITDLKSNLDDNQNHEYTQFLNECVQKLNDEISSGAAQDKKEAAIRQGKKRKDARSAFRFSILMLLLKGLIPIAIICVVLSEMERYTAIALWVVLYIGFSIIVMGCAAMVKMTAPKEDPLSVVDGIVGKWRYAMGSNPIFFELDAHGHFKTNYNFLEVAVDRYAETFDEEAWFEKCNQGPSTGTYEYATKGAHLILTFHTGLDELHSVKYEVANLNKDKLTLYFKGHAISFKREPSAPAHEPI